MTSTISPDRLRFRRATADDAPRLHEIVAAAGRAMAEQGFDNWLSPDATERFLEDIGTREVYAVLDTGPTTMVLIWVRPQFQFSKWGQTLIGAPTGSAVATFTLGMTARRPYSPEPWLDPSAPAFYLNRLAVEPALQGAGLGGWCLRQIEQLARERGVRAVRCDVLTANARLCRLYERFGYLARGERSHTSWRFTCYERVLA